MNKIPAYIIISLILVAFLFSSCENDDYHPKPKGYFRIEKPDKDFVKLDSNLSYSFTYPEYVEIENDYLTEDKHEWINLWYPDFKGTLHLSYHEVNDNLPRLIKDAHEFVDKHIPKANEIKTRKYINDSAQVYGLIYEIKGTGTATPYQFYITDSTQHFVRGALYFETKPNNDSLAPVINFIEKDINKIIESFQWKNQKEIKIEPV